jgi:hypothetical protein
VEARGRDRGGENLVGVNATRGSASEPSGNTGAGGTDPLDAQTLEAAATGKRTTRKCGETSGRQTAWRAAQAERPGSLLAGEIL